MWNDIGDASSVPTNLFYDVDEERSKRLMAAMDLINAAMGDGTLRSAAPGRSRAGGRQRTSGGRRATPPGGTGWSR